MAYRRRRSRRGYRGGYRMSEGKKAMRVLGSFVSLSLGLWIYSEVLDVVIPLVNASTYFGSTIIFIIALIPILGIVAAYKIAKPLFTGM